MEKKDRTEISVVVDGTLIDYVQKEIAYTRISDLENRVKHLQGEKTAAVATQRRAEGRFENLKNAMTRALGEVNPNPGGGWLAEIHAQDMQDVRTLIDGTQTH